MIDEYIDEQKIITTVLKNAVEKNKISHAYLFETNGYQNKDDFVLAFIKYLLCPHNYSNNKNCVDCTQCELIQKGIFSEVKHIYPDGMWIKKEQLEELQQNFSETSVESNKRIYVIHNADRLNTSSANSILKFLEEPEDNIIAILMTDNIHQLLDTIISRCQIISFAKNNKDLEKNYLEKIKKNINMNNDIISLDETILKEKIESAIEFLKYYENNKLDTVLYTQKLFHSKYNNKNEIFMALEIMNLFYLDVIKYKLNSKIEFFNENQLDIEKISKNNSLEQLYKKIDIISTAKDNIFYNINTNLLIDKLIIELVKGDNHE